MGNRISVVVVRDHVVDVAQSEVWVTVVPEELRPTSEVRGRLVGPACEGRTTIEVAYPLRPFPRKVEGLPGLPMRVVIPEPSLWEPADPCLYSGPVQLWEGGAMSDQIWVSHGLRVLRMGPRGLRLNAKQITLQGRRLDRCSEDDARRLRAAGTNTLLVPLDASTIALWELADRFGFLMLGQLAADDEALTLAESVAAQTCSIGWVLADGWAARPDFPAALARLAANRYGHLLGIELDRLPDTPLPRQVHFLATAEALLATTVDLNLPTILLTEKDTGNGRATDGQEVPTNVLGWIEI